MLHKPQSVRKLKQRTAELLHQKAQADALFSSIGDGAIATDDEGKIYRINQVALDMLGYTSEEVLGKWFPKVIVAQDAEGNKVKAINRPITRAFLSGESVTDKIIYLRKDGSPFPVAITVSPIQLDGKPIGAIEVFRDITKEQEIDRMKTEFIYLASHQLRTPLTAVKTYAHMLNEGYRGELTPEQSEFMKIIVSSLDRMNDIISTLLNISRIEAGKMAFNPSTIRLHDTVEQSLFELASLANEKDINIVTSYNVQEDIQTDPILVKEIVINLLSNAIKYTPKGGNIHVAIDLKERHQVVSVKDTGYGIPKESQEQLFRKFFRAPNILDKEEGGTGLGLYLVKGIADVVGGKVWFKSTEGGGSTFYLSLPIPPKSSP